MTYEEIIKTIERAKSDYYQTGRSSLSDTEYDKLVEQAKKLGYIDVVGAAPVDHIEKITHEHPMLSLDKCHTTGEISKFVGRNNSLMMYKADGLTISATYEEGVLTRLETRGNGEVGNNIMFHANSINNLPKHIKKTGKYVIDGECVIMYGDFEKINDKLPIAERYSNPRNLAAGSLNLLDTSVTKKRQLKFYAWDVIEGGCSNSLIANLAEAQSLDFDVIPSILLSGEETNEILKTKLDIIRNHSKEIGFPIDGVVIKYDDIEYGRSLGFTGHHPRNAIAYKYEDDRYPTKLKSISWQVGKFGQITPVANFEPVDCDGVMVEKASLHNISVMKQLCLTNGCTVNIYRANEVIPQIDSAESDGDVEIKIPETCPLCGSPTRIVAENDSEFLFCSNKSCPGRTRGLWKTFVSKKGMDIDGLSEATLEKFLKLGYLTDMFISIYEISKYKNEISKLPGFGKKSVDNLLESIEKSRDVDLIHFLTAFSIPGIGEGQSKLIVGKYPTFELFVKACDNQERFDEIDGIGSILHVNIIKWWVNNHVQMLDVANVVRFKEQFMNATSQDTPISGMTFVITGTLNHFSNRDALKSKIESLGGKVVGSVSKNTDFLINNDVTSTSSKNEKAKKLGVKIISEDDFLKIIE